jgi:aspartate aminotransferase
VPYWVSYPEIVRLCDADPVYAVADASTGFKLTPAALEAAISPRTKWLILNTPSNPTGAAYTPEELRGLAEVLLRHPQVHILTDDIYEVLVYDGGTFATIAGVEPRLRERTLTMNGVSKSHAMTGWRIGYCTGPRPLLGAMLKLQSQSTTNPSSISQWAAVEALNGPQEFLKGWRDVFQGRRDLVVKGLNANTGLDCLTPEGAFYVFPSVKRLLGKTSGGGRALNNDADFVLALLEETGVALVHGSAFGLAGHMRLSYAAANSQLEDAVARIQDFCAKIG